MESDVRVKLAEIILVWSDAETLKECYELADAILERFCVSDHRYLSDFQLSTRGNDTKESNHCYECGKEKSK